MFKKTIANTSIIVMAIVFLSKILGFLRQMLIAGYFGVSFETDAFFLAQGMPSMIFPAVANSLSTAFITVYSIKRSHSDDKGNHFINDTLKLTIFLSIFLSVISLIFLPTLVNLFAPGFDNKTSSLAIDLTKMVMITFIFIMLQYILIAILNSNQKYYAAQFSSVVFNILIVIITIAFGNRSNIYILNATVIIGLIVQDIFLIFFCFKDFKFKLTEKIDFKNIKHLLKIAIPIVFGNSLIQINNIVDKAVASNVSNGAISALSYSTNLTEIVNGVFIMSLSTVLFPSLADFAAKKNFGRFVEELKKNLNLLIFILIPITLITFFYSKEIVMLVYSRGSFNNKAVYLTTKAMIFYSPMFLFSAMRETYTKAFYAIGDAKTPMINSCLGVLINVLSSIMLAPILGVGGIAIGTSISAFVTSILLNRKIKSRYGKVIDSKKLLFYFLIDLIVVIIFKRFINFGSNLINFSLVTLIVFSINFYIKFIYNKQLR
ncbi:MAG: murein biosynthesis integral membrane protein MurJ [Bacilli bacterium]